MTYTYGDTNHKHAVTSTTAGSTFQYDANGNMTRRVVGGSTYNLARACPERSEGTRRIAWWESAE